jgi:hypothetical protein
MALKMNVTDNAGHVHTDSYVIIVSSNLARKPSETKWRRMIEVRAFKNKTERNKGALAKCIESSQVDRFKVEDVAPDAETKKPIAQAYDDLKTGKVKNGGAVFVGAMDA